MLYFVTLYYRQLNITANRGNGLTFTKSSTVLLSLSLYMYIHTHVWLLDNVEYKRFLISTCLWNKKLIGLNRPLKTIKKNINYIQLVHTVPGKYNVSHSYLKCIRNNETLSVQYQDCFQGRQFSFHSTVRFVEHLLYSLNFLNIITSFIKRNSCSRFNLPGLLNNMHIWFIKLNCERLYLFIEYLPFGLFWFLLDSLSDSRGLWILINCLTVLLNSIIVIILLIYQIVDIIITNDCDIVLQSLEQFVALFRSWTLKKKNK